MFEKNKYDNEEQLDYELFKTFNNRAKHKRLFCPTESGKKFDIMGVNLESKIEEVIELKLRKHYFLNTEKYDGIFIEPWKYDNLMDYWKQGYKPIYINFFDNNAEDVWIWILPEIDESKIGKRDNIWISGKYQSRRILP